MKKLLNIGLLAAVALASSCSKDESWLSNTSGETGSFSTKGLMLEFQNEEKVIRKTRAGGIDVADFTIDILKAGQTVGSYNYAEMPEVLTLPVGDDYTARAYYGDNKAAAFEEPYFEGTQDFAITANQITEANTITCNFSNIKVTVDFDDLLEQNMKNASVTVKVGDGAELVFNKDNEGTAGYFAYAEGSNTLAAEFSGEVQGFQTNETKLFEDVKPGNYYKITFRLHTINGDDTGTASGAIVVDAEVEIDNINADFDIEDSYLDDDRFPVETEDPVDPTDPSEPKAPSLVGIKGTNLDVLNDADAVEGLALEVTSYAEGGLTGFDVEIISPTLTPEELESVGLAANLDLVNPGAHAEILSNLGFPVNIGGEHHVILDITGFKIMLAALGDGDHEFKMTVTDANGTTVKSLRVHVKGV